MCEINKPVNIIKACKEGPRRILMVGLKINQVQIRDADNGLLLRALNLGEKYTIYSLVLDGGYVHCGTNSNEVVTLDFTVSTIKIFILLISFLNYVKLFLGLVAIQAD